MLMENHLTGRHYFVGDSLTLADIALYAYTHVAKEGGFDLVPFLNVQSWLGRIASLDNHVSIND